MVDALQSHQLGCCIDRSTSRHEGNEGGFNRDSATLRCVARNASTHALANGCVLCMGCRLPLPIPVLNIIQSVRLGTLTGSPLACV